MNFTVSQYLWSAYVASVAAALVYLFVPKHPTKRYYRSTRTVLAFVMAAALTLAVIHVMKHNTYAMLHKAVKTEPDF